MDGLEIIRIITKRTLRKVEVLYDLKAKDHQLKVFCQPMSFLEARNKEILR